VTSPGPRLPDGVLAGHWTDRAGLTGCTVVLVPAGATGGVDVRGGAPGTLGTDGLRPGTLAGRVHGVLLTGGSAFGLDAAGGVMRYLDELGVGLDVGGVRVPIVAGAVIFDLLNGDARARPDAGAGYAACQAATATPEVGAVGAGTGATVAKAGGLPRPGGLGIATVAAGAAIVTAVMVANSVGGIWDDDRHDWIAPVASGVVAPGPAPGANTTIGVVVTDAELTREQANRVAAVAHDGIARSVRPAHTRYDGDTLFCLATGAVPAGAGGADQADPRRVNALADAVEAAAAQAVARAIAAAVRGR
jgi:L-aminopeptidase/D-esterase-like protein